MDIIRAIILGIVQGLTEFLPVSSSGHLEIANHLMGSNEGLDNDLTMVIITHLGTALSILYVFRNDILSIIKSIIGWKKDEDFSLAMKIIVSMIPAFIIGMLFEDQLEALFSADSLLYVGIFLCITGIVLWFTPKENRDDGKVTFARSLYIGIAQAIAILPGISRSGMTIASALYLGVDRAQAARFSFLMVLPIIFGKVILDVAGGDLQISSTASAALFSALASSFIVGVLACKWMLKIVQNAKLSYFAIYCFVVGALVVLSAVI